MASMLPRNHPQILWAALWACLLIGVPLLLAVWALGLPGWDLSIPLTIRNADDIWQLALTKVLRDTGWVLTNPYLGAPEVAHWHHNAAAQTSALHSVLMLAMSPFIRDAVQLQQVYYLLNFPLICLTSFVSCRLLGVARLPSFCVGLLFAFTPLRFNEMFYAFIPNYFMIPLALVAVIWILSGKFAALLKQYEGSGGRWQMAVHLLRSREFVLGLFFVVLTATSDGYYAFFTLLLLCFAVFARVLLGDWRRPLALLPAGAYVLSLLAVSLSLQMPLHHFKKTHWSEFYPSGVKDPVLTKHPFEAEIYSSSLKLSIAPISEHRIERLGRLGKWVVATRDEAYIIKRGNAYVPFGTLGSLLFGVALVLLTIPALKSGIAASMQGPRDPDSSPAAFGDALLSLTLFIFLCSIAGGVGTLVALVFPTIRAYDRFPLFLMFVLYLGFAWGVTVRLRCAGWQGRVVWTCSLLLVTTAALYDQIPRNSRKGDESSKAQFLAERHFVQKVEDVLPPNAMVYQYPYSQYLRLNKYYGWGSFAHIRLYLHSRRLRWSNGGAKNSPGDDWNFRIAQMPLENLITEVEAVGFGGFVIDRTVLNSSEYQKVRHAFASRGYDMLEDESSKLAFVRLRAPGFRLVYDPTYQQADRIVVTDRDLLAHSELPRIVLGSELHPLLARVGGDGNITIDRATYPEVFVDGSTLTRGMGQVAIVPLADMKGELNCGSSSNGRAVSFDETVTLTLHNRSQFDWKLGEGPLPIQIGVHLQSADGRLISFDDGFRLPMNAYIRRDDKVELNVILKNISPVTSLRGRDPIRIEFAVVQDGNAWFDSLRCSVLVQS